MTNKDAIDKFPSTWVLIHGILAFHVIALIVTLSSLIIFIGPFFYPKSIGLFITIPYFTYTLFIRRDELNDGAHWSRFTTQFWVFKSMRRFLQLDIAPIPRELVDAEKKDGAQFVIGVFPHGSWADYRVVMDGLLPQVFPNIHAKVKTLAASVLFRIPVVRELSLWTGCVDARRSVAERQLDNGQSLLIIPGGEAEQIRTEFGKEIVYVMNRKGFIKLAMRKNAQIVPAYVFGCSDYYRTSPLLFDIRVTLVKSLGICIPFAAGYLGSPICPLPIKSTIVFGKPIHFNVKENGLPTSEELDDAHTKFVESLKALFDAHKVEYGYGERELEIM